MNVVFIAEVIIAVLCAFIKLLVIYTGTDDDTDSIIL